MNSIYCMSKVTDETIILTGKYISKVARKYFPSRQFKFTRFSNCAGMQCSVKYTGATGESPWHWRTLAFYSDSPLAPASRWLVFVPVNMFALNSYGEMDLTSEEVMVSQIEVLLDEKAKSKIIYE